MNTDYIKYLLYISLVVFLFGILIVYSHRKRKSKTISAVEKALPIDCGNISVFFDKDNNVSILAYVTDLFGVGKACGTPMILKMPYSLGELGDAVRKAMSQCKRAVPCSDSELMDKLGFKNWKEFSYGKRNISVHFREGYGVILNSTTRKLDGAYQFNRMGFEKVVPQETSNEDLAKALREILQKCRG